MTTITKLLRWAWISLSVSNAVLLGQKYYDATLATRLSLANNISGSLLQPFNITRTPGSIGSAKVQNFLYRHFESLQSDWLSETQSFSAGGHNFTNLVFTLGANASSYMMIAAHYDSKILPNGFIGATDSAASCAILLYISEFVDNFLSTDRNMLLELFSTEATGLKIVFFDGEEAIENWNAEDSIYGAKHLASSWEREDLLKKIDLMVLLDLLGSNEELTVPSFFKNTHSAFRRMAAIKDENLSLMPYKGELFNTQEDRFLDLNQPSIEDDHIPFLQAGVPILHLITFPFPSYWHTLEDDFSNLDEKKIQSWAIILCEFLSTQYSTLL